MSGQRERETAEKLIEILRGTGKIRSTSRGAEFLDSGGNWIEIKDSNSVIQEQVPRTRRTRPKERKTVNFVLVFANRRYVREGDFGFEYEHNVWVCSNAFRDRRPVLIYSLPPFEPEPAIVPPISIYLASDRQKTVHIDIKVQDFYVDSGGSILPRNDLILKHWQLRGNQLQEVSSSSSWRAPFVNSTTNVPLSPASGFPTCQAVFWDDGISPSSGVGLPTFQPASHDFRGSTIVTSPGHQNVDFGEDLTPDFYLRRGQLPSAVYTINDNSCVGPEWLTLLSVPRRVGDTARFPSIDISEVYSAEIPEQLQGHTDFASVVF